MTRDERLATGAVEGLEFPPGDAAFFVRLRAELLERERASARRWRRATAAVVGAAAAALLATGIYAAVSGSTTVDRTLQCPVEARAGVRELSLSADPHFGAADTDYPAGIYFETGQGTLLLGFDTNRKGYSLNGALCRAAKPALPFTSAGLASAGTFLGGRFAGFRLSCRLRGPLRFRVALRETHDGVVEAARLVVKAGKPLRPVAYVSWSAARVRAFAAGRCETG